MEKIQINQIVRRNLFKCDCGGGTATYRHPFAKVWCLKCGCILREEGDKTIIHDETISSRVERVTSKCKWAICKKTYPDEDDINKWYNGELDLDKIKIYQKDKMYLVVEDFDEEYYSLDILSNLYNLIDELFLLIEYADFSNGNAFNGVDEGRVSASILINEFKEEYKRIKGEIK